MAKTTTVYLTNYDGQQIEYNDVEYIVLPGKNISMSVVDRKFEYKDED